MYYICVVEPEPELGRKEQECVILKARTFQINRKCELGK
jgi:hypothetical protein